MLTDQELAQLRADVLETLPETCMILRPSASADTYGHADPTYGTAVVSVRCRLDPEYRRGNGELVAGREANRSYFTLSLPYDADLRDGDRVVIASGNYEVWQLHGTQTMRAVKRAVVVKTAGA